ncbi:MAG: type II toxin-antitoxin system VapC family toxin [Geobacter sp.]|nr:type II toxin-antitoxin system VapC family toxin [Geobacter sp.]
MNCLLDTHALLWSLFEPGRLGKTALDLLQDQQHTIYVSTVSIWEISLKYSIGKLELQGTTPDAFPDLIRQTGFELLPLAAQDAATFHKLPRLEHKDPFDRLLIWQAITHKLTFVSQDKACSTYRKLGLKVVW